MVRSFVNLLTIKFNDKSKPGFFIKTMFDYVSDPSARKRGRNREQSAEDRVVAVWGLSRAEPAESRDKSRMAGFLRGAWAGAYAGYDRGHFFAHTMGGGLDINLFPQIANVNRGGNWRKMEVECAGNPGTFCFIRPIYSNSSWKPTRLEYGIFRMPPAYALNFLGAEFSNEIGKPHGTIR